MQHWKRECAYILNSFLSVNIFILMHVFNFILFQQGQCLQWHDIKNSDKQRVNGKWRQEKKWERVLEPDVIHIQTILHRASPDGSDGKEFTCNAGDPDSIPELGRFPGEGNGNLLQYSCLRNPIDRGAWWATVHRVTKSQTQLSD